MRNHVGLLMEADRRLTQYREAVGRAGHDRLALSDLVTYMSLLDRYEMDVDKAAEVMAQLIEADEQPVLDRSGYVYQDHEDQVSDAMQRLGLNPYPDWDELEKGD